MAFYIMWKHEWFRRHHEDMIAWYKHHLFELWFDSLSEEEKETYRQNEEARRKKARTAAGMLLMTSSILHSMGTDTYL